MLAVAAALAVAAPALADDTPADDGFTGETAAVSETAATQQSCADPTVAPVLAAFKDNADYFFAPGGDFEGPLTGWQLAGGARVVDDGFLALDGGSNSLDLPAGSSATSPAFCVDERFPKFRLAVGNLGIKSAQLSVSVVYPDVVKNVRHAGDLGADPNKRWHLSKSLDVQPQYGRKDHGWRLIALRFQVDRLDPGADVRVDDVLVDPKMRF
jgi:hypothetical protein